MSEQNRREKAVRSGDYTCSVKPDECFLLTRYVTRPLAYPIAVAAARLGVSPNAVTLVGGSLWVGSIVLLLLGGWGWAHGHPATGWTYLLTAALFWNLGVVLDVADGSLARLSGGASKSGHFLDYVFHLLFNPMFLAGVGVMLFLVSGWIGYAVLGLLASSGNWGLAFSAREHVLCESVAKGDIAPAELSIQERYGLFIDSVDMNRPVLEKASGIRMLREVLKEAILFPGQFTAFSVALLADFAVWLLGGPGFVCMQLLFVAVAVTILVRVPFRIRREYCTLSANERFFKKN